MVFFFFDWTSWSEEVKFIQGQWEGPNMRAALVLVCCWYNQFQDRLHLQAGRLFRSQPENMRAASLSVPLGQKRTHNLSDVSWGRSALCLLHCSHNIYTVDNVVIVRLLNWHFKTRQGVFLWAKSSHQHVLTVTASTCWCSPCSQS